MASYKLFPTKDTTLYSGYPVMNTGLDAINEATTNFKIGQLSSDGNNPQSSRTLMAFSQTEILDVIDNKINGATYQVNLKSFNANTKGLTNTSTLIIGAVAEDWSMGSGQYLLNPEVDNGASWKFRTQSGSNSWTTDGSISGTTGSYNLLTNSNSTGGGSWYTAYQASQSFAYYASLDLNVNVTDIVQKWVSSGFNNYGFIIRQSASQEFIDNDNNQLTHKFFSRDTNTIYPPTLDFKWDDYVFSTGSSNHSIITDEQALISIYNNVETYYSESITKFRVAILPKYPTRQYQTSSLYTTNYYLPESQSLYAIKDATTNEYVIDFHPTYTRISADSDSSYFNIYMNGLEPERYYTILIKTIIGGITRIFDENMTFRVI